MSTQLNVSVSGNVNGSQTVQATSIESGGTDLYINQTFAASTTNQAVTASFVVANVQGFVLIPTTNMTLKTNSSSSPAQTFSLIANEPFVWKKGWVGWYANPFTTDVTAFYVTCTSAGQLKGHVVTS